MVKLAIALIFFMLLKSLFSISKVDRLLLITFPSSFVKADRRKIIMLGVFAAFIFRVIFALVTVQLLQYPILKIVGGALLVWIIFKLVQDLQLFDVFKITKPKAIKQKKQPSFIGGVYAVIIADVTLSFDNVLGVAAAARNETVLLIFGLLLSVFLIATVATFFADYLKKHSWVGILGLLIILYVAFQLIAVGYDTIDPIAEPFRSFLTKIKIL